MAPNNHSNSALRKYLRFEAMIEPANLATKARKSPLTATPSTQAYGAPALETHPAQHDSCATSFVKVWAASFSPSTIVR